MNDTEKTVNPSFLSRLPRRISPALWKTLHYFSIACVSIVLLLMIAVYVGGQYIDDYRPSFEQWASHVAHQPVSVKRISLQWHRLQPSIALDEVRILSADQQYIVMHIPKLNVVLSLWKTLLQRTPVPSSLTLTGSHLDVFVDAHNQLSLSGFQQEAGQRLEQQHQKILKDTLAWLFSHSRIQLQHFGLDVHLPKHALISLADLNVVTKYGLLESAITGTGTMLQSEPVPLRFHASLHGKNYNLKEMTADVKVDVQHLNFAEWPTLIRFHRHNLKSGVADLSVQFHWDKGQLGQLQSTLTAKQLLLAPRQIENADAAQPVEHPLLIDHLSSHLVWQTDDTGWNLQLNRFSMRALGLEWPESTIIVKSTFATDDAPMHQVMQSTTLPLPLFEKVFPMMPALPAAFFSQWKTLAPNGTLYDCVLEHTGKDWALKNIKATAQLKDFSMHRWQTWPAVQNVSGQFHFTPEEGMARLVVADNTLQIPSLFDHPVSFKKFSGTLTWKHDAKGWQWHGDGLRLLTPELDINSGTINLLWAPLKKDRTLQFKIGVDALDAAHLKKILPTKLLRKKLTTWLSSALQGGGLDAGSLSFNGPLSTFPMAATQSDNFTVVGQFSGLMLQYHKDWPRLNNLKGQLTFSGQSMGLHIDSGQTGGATFSGVDASIADLHTPELFVEGKINTDMAVGQQFLGVTPLKKTYGERLKPYVLSGPMALSLKLDVPINKPGSAVRAHGKIALSGKGRVNLPAWRVTLDQLHGDIEFGDGLIASKEIKGIAFGQPMTLQLQTLPSKKKGQFSETRVFLKSVLGLNALFQQLKHPDFSHYMMGTMQYKGVLSIRHDAKGPLPMTAQFSSELEGVDVHLPLPLFKEAGSKKLLVLNLMPIDDGHLNVDLQYGTQDLSGRLYFEKNKKAWRFARGGLLLGGPGKIKIGKKGLVVGGHFKTFKFNVWKPFLSVFSGHQPESHTPDAPRLEEVMLSADEFQAFNHHWKHVELDYLPGALGWRLGIRSPFLAGHLFWPEAYPKKPLNITFDRVRLPSGATQAVAGFKLEDVPPMTVLAKHLHIGKIDLGLLQFELQPVTPMPTATQTPGGKKQPTHPKIRIPYLELEGAGTHLKASGWWERVRGKPYTAIKGQLSTKNFGLALKRWNFTHNVVGGQGHANLDVRWQGAPYDINLNSAVGKLNLDFRHGRIINLSSGTANSLGMARMLNLFSLPMLARHLSLDFSDLTEKGYHFDTLSGDFLLRRGSIITRDMVLDGPVAKIDVRGSVGLPRHTYNLRLIVAPTHLTASLPIIATVAAGPIAGLVTWFADKVFTPAVGEMTKKVYHVTGSWDHPKITTLHPHTAAKTQWAHR